jgi:hypothetical protein
MPRQNYADLYNWGVKFSKLKLLLGVLITSLFISSCAEYEYVPVGYGITYEDFRTGLQDLQPLEKVGYDFRSAADYAHINHPWWECWQDGENFRKFQENKKDADTFKSTLSWEQIGYCLPQIDSIINGYLNLKIWKDTDANSFDPIELSLIKMINPSSKMSAKSVCKKIIPTDQSPIQRSFRGEDINSELLLQGCINRFSDTLVVKIAYAKNEIAMIAEAMRQAEIDAAAEAEAAEALEPVDTNSREYITGLTIGNNFSDFSDAGAIAEDVCATARDRRIVLSSRGGVGVDPRTASFLSSKEGFQGCIDGFNGVPQD